MANDEEITEKIKKSFENLSQLLITNEEWLHPIFLAIASNNTKMGDWMIAKFLTLKST